MVDKTKEDIQQKLKDLQKSLNELDVDTEEGKDIRKKLEQELKGWQNSIKGSSFDVEKWEEWKQNVGDWIGSKQSLGVLTIVIQQLLMMSLLMLLRITPLAFISNMYVACLPVVLAAQGELWKEGVGQFIGTEDKTSLDVVIRTLFQTLALFGLIALSMERSYSWFLIAIVVMTLFVNQYATPLIVSVIEWFNSWLEGDMDTFEKEYTRYRYGWNWFHIPIMSIAMGVGIGTVAIYCVSLVESYLMDNSVTGPLLKDIIVIED